MKTFTTGISTAILAMACSMAFAQEKAQFAGKERTSGPQLQVANFFAGKLMLMNQSTIKMSELAQDRSGSEDVRAFAKSLAEGHAELNKQLREFAPDVVDITTLQETRTTGFRGAEKSESDRSANNPSEQKRPRDNARNTDRSGTAGPWQQVLTIERVATQNYLRASNQMLERYQGQDFDMGYLGFQIGSHTWALAEMKALDNVGDEKFQKIVDEAAAKVENHLLKAKELSKKYEDQERPRSSGSEETKEAKSNR